MYEVDVLSADKHERLLQVDSVFLDGSFLCDIFQHQDVNSWFVICII